MTEIRSIKPVAAGHSEECVNILERLLAEAKKGEILEFTLFATHPGNRISMEATACDDLMSVLAAIHRAAHTTQLRLDSAQRRV